MNCAEVYNWLQAYLDANVNAEQERAVEAHVRACLDCRHKLVELARAVNALERTQPLTPRQEFTRKLYAAIEREAGRPLPPASRAPRAGRRPDRRPG